MPDLQAMLAEVNSQARAALAHHDKLRAEFFRLDGIAERMAIRLMNYNSRIEQHLAAKPDDASFPTAEEMAAWQRRLKTLQYLQRKAVNRRADAQGAAERARFAVIKAAGAVESLLWSQRSLTNQIQGPVQSEVNFV